MAADIIVILHPIFFEFSDITKVLRVKGPISLSAAVQETVNSSTKSEVYTVPVIVL